MGLEEQLEKFFRDRVKVGKINNQKYPIAVPMYKTNSGLYSLNISSILLYSLIEAIIVLKFRVSPYFLINSCCIAYALFS